MSFAIGLGGIVVALVFLTFAVYKGWSILYSSIIGVIIIALTNGMNLLGVDVSFQYIVKGAIFILAVAFDVISRKK